ncbi:MAG: DNA polymerase III subunit gamma/tau [bacterium]|nr:DNA polymerase III subunit gamma/tau [bacterium]
MSYQAIARKYRPETFDQVVGQTHVTGTLRAAMARDKLSHAYLFSGPRGCGKTTVARLLAKAINCQTNRDGDPCGTCETCEAIARGSYLDVLEIDAASNTGVDNIRELRDMAQYSPSEGSSRVFIIDEVHMLSKGAFNALLKILEEPPKRVFFFFATTEPNKIPRTILSRCQRFDFRLLTRDELGARMQKIATNEGITLEDTGQRLLVSLAEGSVRDGLSLLDQVIAGCDGTITEETVVSAFGLVRSQLYVELNEAVIAKDATRALRLVHDLSTAGQSLDAFARGIVSNFRNLMLLKIDPELGAMVDLPPEQVEQLGKQAANFSEQDLLALIDRSGQHFERIHRSTQPRIMLEASLVEYCRFESRVLLSDLAHRLDAMGGSLPAGGGNSSGRAPAPAVKRPAPSPGATGMHAQGNRPAPGASQAVPPSGPNSAARSAQPSPTANTAARVADESVPGWTQLIDSLMAVKPAAAACLMEGLPTLDKGKGSLVVIYEKDKEFKMQMVKRDTSIISEAASKQFGCNIKVEFQLGQEGQQENVKEEIRRTVAPTSREELDKARAKDPALNQLVETMDGDPLHEEDRDKWKKN